MVNEHGSIAGEFYPEVKVFDLFNKRVPLTGFSGAHPRSPPCKITGGDSISRRSCQPFRYSHYAPPVFFYEVDK